MFQNHQATCCLFEVIQDFSQNFVGIQNSFNEMRMALLNTIVANPTLSDAHLSQIENQLHDCLCQVTHTIQAVVQQRFAVVYLNLMKMAELFKKLEEQTNEAGCELLVQYHSDL
jgi:hypothetical protein